MCRFAALIIVLINTPVIAQSLVGKEVMAIKWGAELKEEHRVVGNLELGTILHVDQENGDWLWVHRGWVQRRDVRPVAEAIAYLTGQIQSNPSATNYHNRAAALYLLGEFDKALADENEAIRLDGQAASYNVRAACRSAKQEYDLAIRDYDEAIRLQKVATTRAFYHSNRGNAWRDKGDDDKAIADYDEAIRLDPNFSMAFNNRGNYWGDKGNNEKAIADFNEAIRIDPKHTLAYLNRGLTWSDKEDFEKAIADFNEAIRIDPQNANAFVSGAWLWATCPDAKYRNGRKAIESATKACELTAWKRWDDLDTLAASYAEAGDFELALKWQGKSLELSPESNKQWAQYRLELYKSGKPFRESKRKSHVE